MPRLLSTALRTSGDAIAKTRGSTSANVEPSFSPSFSHPHADAETVFCDEENDGRVHNSIGFAVPPLSPHASFTHTSLPQQHTVEGGSDLYVFLPQIHSACAATGAPPPPEAKARADLAQQQPLPLPQPNISGRAQSWAAAPSCAPFSIAIEDTSVLRVPVTLSARALPSTRDHDVAINLFHATTPTTTQRSVELSSNNNNSDRSEASYIRFTGTWEVLCIPHVLTADAQHRLHKELAPLPRDSMPSPAHRTSHNDGDGGHDKALSEEDEGEAAAAGLNTTPDGGVGDEAGSEPDASAGAAFMPTTTATSTAPMRLHNARQCTSCNDAARAGSLKRLREPSCHDKDGVDDAENSPLVEERDVRRALREDGFARFQTLHATCHRVVGRHRRTAQSVGTLTTRATTSATAAAARPSSSFSSSSPSSQSYAVQFGLHAHWLTCRLPPDTTEQLLASLLSQIGERTRPAVMVPFWIACFAHTHRVCAPLLTRLTAAHATQEASCGVHHDSSECRYGCPYVALHWPVWVPTLAASLGILNALQAAAWSVVGDLVKALAAETRVCPLSTQPTTTTTTTEHVDESVMSSAALSLAHFTDAVLSPSRRWAALSVVQSHLPFPVHRADLARYPPAPHQQQQPRGLSEATQCALRRAVEWPAAITGAVDSSSSSSSSSTVTPHVWYPSLVEVVHYLALRLVSSYLPHVATQLQGFLSLRMQQAMPDDASTAQQRTESGGNEADQAVAAAAAAAATTGVLSAAVARTVARGVIDTIPRLALWKTFWQSRDGSFETGADALRISVTVSQWSMRVFLWLLLPTTPDSTGPGNDVDTVALLLAVVPGLCRDFLNNQEQHAVLSRGFEALANAPAASCADAAFRLLVAVLISHPRASASETRDPTTAQAIVSAMWAEWLVPLGHTLDTSVTLDHLLARVGAALRVLRSQLHALSAANIAGNEESGGRTTAAEETASTVDAGSSLFFAAASAAPSACSGGPLSGVDVAAACSSVLFEMTEMNRGTVWPRHSCPWLHDVHRCDVRDLRASLHGVRQRVDAERHAERRTGSLITRHAAARNEEDDEDGAERPAECLQEALFDSHDALIDDDEEEQDADAASSNTNESQEDEYFFAMLADGGTWASSQQNAQPDRSARESGTLRASQASSTAVVNDSYSSNDDEETLNGETLRTASA